MKKIIISLSLVAMGTLAIGSVASAAVELAKIGSKSITDVDIKNLLGNIPDAQRQQVNSDAKLKVNIFENIVTEELFVLEAEKSGITKDKEYQQTIERMRRQLLAQRYLQKNIQPKLTDANIKGFFEKNKARYSQDEVHAYHVLLKTEAEAKEVYQKAKAGEDFEVLAKKYSKDPSAAQNMGDLGFFTRSRMVPQFADAAFSMKPGEISQPVQTNFGYHVIKVVEKKAGKPVKFDDVKDQAREDYRMEAQNELISSLRKSNKVTIHEDKVKSFQF